MARYKTIACGRCGKPFEAVRSTARYCPECKQPSQGARLVEIWERYGGPALGLRLTHSATEIKVTEEFPGAAAYAERILQSHRKGELSWMYDLADLALRTMCIAKRRAREAAKIREPQFFGKSRAPTFAIYGPLPALWAKAQSFWNTMSIAEPKKRKTNMEGAHDLEGAQLWAANAVDIAAAEFKMHARIDKMSQHLDTPPQGGRIWKGDE
jgi:hypothetical protein